MNDATFNINNCPFCGEDGKIKYIQVPYTHGWVGCPSCGCYIQWNHDPHGAVQKWNKRALR